jgi:hypothetical protein
MKAIAKIFVVVLLLGATSAASFASPVRGPLSDTARCPANRTIFYNEVFRGGENATVSIVGDGDTDLDLYVYDANGNLIARAVGLSDRETISFFPFQTGTFRIEVRNLGNVWNQYTITMR